MSQIPTIKRVCVSGPVPVSSMSKALDEAKGDESKAIDILKEARARIKLSKGERETHEESSYRMYTGTAVSAFL